MRVVRFGDVAWEPRVEDDWPCLVKRLLTDEAADVVLRTVWYARGAVEPRHTHTGTHAAVVLIGAAVVDDVTLGPWDVVYGPGGHPHGPLHYPNGCMLFALVRGGAHHTAAGGASADVPPGLAPQFLAEAARAWRPAPGGAEHKVLVDDRERRFGCGLLRWPAARAASLPAVDGSQAAVLLQGRATVAGIALDPWDVVYLPSGEQPEIAVSAGCTMALNLGGVLE